MRACGLLEARLVAGAHRDGAALGRERLGDGEPHPGRRAADDRSFPLESQIHAAEA